MEQQWPFCGSVEDNIAKNEFTDLCKEKTDIASEIEYINDTTVENVNKCMQEMKLGKACGTDQLSVEHLIHAHPEVILLFESLFCSMSLHHHVSGNFGFGTINPLVKNKCGDTPPWSNYS
jgi:hypothetical protein